MPLMILGLVILQLSKTITTRHIAELRSAYCSNALIQVVLQHKLSAPYVLQSDIQKPSSAGAAQPLHQIKSQAQEQPLAIFFCASTTWCCICLSRSVFFTTENRIVLTFQAVLMCQKLQNLRLSMQSAAIIRLLLCCQNWTLYLTAVEI